MIELNEMNLFSKKSQHTVKYLFLAITVLCAEASPGKHILTDKSIFKDGDDSKQLTTRDSNEERINLSYPGGCFLRIKQILVVYGGSRSRPIP